MDFSYDIDTITKDAVVIIGDRMRTEREARLGRLLDDAVAVTGKKNRAYVRVENDLEATIAIYPVGFDLALLEKDAPVKVKLQNGDYVVTGVSPKLGSMFWPDNTPGSSINFATLVLGTANSLFPNAQVLGDLATGLLKNTTGAGLLSIAVAGTDYAAATHTHQSSGQGGQLDAGLVFNAGTVPLARGGGAASFAGLTTGALVAKLASSLGAATLTANAIMIGGASGVPSFLAPGSNGNIAVVAGGVWTSAAPAFNASVITAGQLALARGGSGADLSATGPGYIVQATAGAVFSNAKANFSATAAPTTGDDSGDGYAATSWWFDLTNGAAYWLKDPTLGAAVWIPAGGSSGPWTTTSNVVHQNTLTDAVAVGANTNNDAKFYVLGDDVNEKVLRIRAASSQADSIVVIENNAGTTSYLIIGATGAFTQDGAVYVFNEGGGDFDGRFEGDTDANLWFLDASTDSIGIGTNAPSDWLHLKAATTARAPLRLPLGVKPTSPNAGAMWTATTEDDLFVFLRGLSRNPTWVGFTKASQTSVSGTLVATSLLGTIVPTNGNILPANFFKSGTTIVGRIGGTHDVATGTSLNSVLLFQLDGANILSQPLGTLTTTDSNWHVEFVLTCQTTGSSGAFAFGLTGRIGATNVAVATFVNGLSTSFTANTGNELTFDILIDPDDVDVIWRCDYMAVWSLN